VTSSGVPVGDTTLLAAMRGIAVLIEDWSAFEEGTVERRHADELRLVRDALVTLIEAAQELWLASAEKTGNPTPIDVFDVLGPALAPFVGEATQ
jgi:hypothetical protein